MSKIEIAVTKPAAAIILPSVLRRSAHAIIETANVTRATAVLSVDRLFKNLFLL